MVKKLVAGAACIITVSGLMGIAEASLMTIGKATYNNNDYSLIWETSNNGNSLVWLDYTNAAETWQNQNAWAASLDGLLTYKLEDGYSVNWTGNWRLPFTVDGVYEEGFGGFNITTSEMGYLYYTEFGYTWDDPGKAADNAFFKNLLPPNQPTIQDPNYDPYYYWSATSYLNADLAWRFSWWNGGQNAWFQEGENGFPHLGLAVRNADVTYNHNSEVPEPATILLFSAGLGLISMRKKREK